ncbi:hypothetical protein B0T17DRAFT_612360 [Bombardia bombarda]|uniref:Microsomal glutathione S-transferase 3 n=1 Tax=Bombardia bombarda TaxID=252184 RepID=A0AA39XK70_9PEZI|nr:hypothetical protein B0T17DRAFT_612360 [Bombardia bombarda]
MSFTIPQEYGYVLLAATSTFFVNSFHSITTSKYRKASGIKYPTAYASTEVAEKDPKAYRFNCAQRAHAHFTETLTPFLGALLIAGLRFPTVAAGLGAAWSTFRVIYVLGYTSSKGPAGRVAGSIASSLIDMALKLTATYTAFKLIQGDY